VVTERHAGVGVPLFSMRSADSWGIGEPPDLARFADWLARAGFDRLLILPIGPLPFGETSPYAPASTMAIDPLYIALPRVAEFEHAGGLGALSSVGCAALAIARHAPGVRYDMVRRAKVEALDHAFDGFLAREWASHTPRARALAAYVERERWWLDDYALFQALTTAEPGSSWREWPGPLRDRVPAALADARRAMSRELLRHQYWQWLAETQWQAARAHAARRGVAIVGDLPFAAGPASADVWARADEFALDVSVGVPPDAFSPSGQDWGLPAYRWDVLARSGYVWMRQRARRMAALFDLIRVDHVIGLYRTYGRTSAGDAFFSPADEADQRRQGETVLGILGEGGAGLIAEDLGTVPDFVRASLDALGIPGCRVVRWERRWHDEGRPYVDPRHYPVVSAAMTGTHDTEPLALWWDGCPLEERRAILALPVFREWELTDPALPWTDELRDAHLLLAYSAASSELFLPVQDLFGWRARVNTPGTVAPENWTWCLPWPVDRWVSEAEPHERGVALRKLASRAGRLRARVD
jgi:4-alpha-glucanotransferase